MSELILLFVLILANAYFAAAEIAFICKLKKETKKLNQLKKY